jgi:hypothetical protein
MDVMAWLPPWSLLFCENSATAKLPARLRAFQLHRRRRATVARICRDVISGNGRAIERYHWPS